MADSPELAKVVTLDHLIQIFADLNLSMYINQTLII